ncbi:hypothetical protein LSAT2_017572 [Lamellibrachia satsuma]|nr:hypothetical protein LSAT2_017572 [Lamellibrachia satsuma]
MAQVHKPQPAPKPALRLVEKPAPKLAPKPVARSQGALSKPTVAQKPRVGAPSLDKKPTGVVTENARVPTSVHCGETTVKPQPRAKKRKSIQKQHPRDRADETGIKTEAVPTHKGQDDSTATAGDKDNNENVVEQSLQKDICRNGQETQIVSSSNNHVFSCETVKKKQTETVLPEDATVSAQCVKPRGRVTLPKPLVPAKPKSAKWKSVRTTEGRNTTEERTSGEAGAAQTEAPSNTESLQSDGECKQVTVPCSADTVLVLSDDSPVTLRDGDTGYTNTSRSSLRRSGSYEAAVTSEDQYYDDVVCKTQQVAQKQGKSVDSVEDTNMTHTDAEDDFEQHDTDNVYSELSDCKEEDEAHEGKDNTVGESDTEEGPCYDAGGVYSYADMPLVSSDTEAAEHPDSAIKESEISEQKKQTSVSLGVSFKAFFKGKLSGRKKEKVRKKSTTSFYCDAKSETTGDHLMDSAVRPTAESEESDSDDGHDYIYIDDLHEPERSQSDSMPVLPPRRKRNASRKAMLDMKVVVQRRREPSRSDDDNEYIIPEYDAKAEAQQEQAAELFEDEGYLVPQDPQFGETGSGDGELRDSGDYVLPQELVTADTKEECSDGDYLVPVSEQDKKESPESVEKQDDDDDYLVPVSMTREKERSGTLTPCHLSDTVTLCHLSDSESEDDEYVRPGCQDIVETLTREQNVDTDWQGLESQHSPVSQEDLSSSRVSGDMSTDVSSELSYYTNNSRMSLSHNDLHQVRPSLLHPSVMSLKRRSFPESGTYSNCTLPSGVGYGEVYVPMDSSGEALKYADSHGSESSFSESHSDMSDYETVGVHDSPVEEIKGRPITHIVQEIASSEKTFVDVLRLLNERFRCTVDRANQHLGRPVLPQAVLDQVLKYLPMLQDFNTELLKDIEERLTNWESDPRIADIFVKKGPFLKLYTSYIREFEIMCNTLEEARRKYPEFDRVVVDFETSAQCAGLALKHYMLKPIQRIPQYRLLLQEYKKSVSSDAADYKDILTALVIVSEVADHANESMQYRDNVGKLLDIQNSLISRCEVIKPGRFLLKEGILMKLSRKEMQPRRFILLNDALLYTTQVTGGYKLNNELPLSGMKVSKPLKEAFQNEFSIISTRRSFTISARTSEERDEWLEALQKAIEENHQKRYSFEMKRSHLPALAYIEMDADFKLGTRAPVWIPDARVSMCMLCTTEFTVTFRRHHCRACGKVVCRVCSDYKAPLRYLTYKPDRVCKSCFEQLRQDMSALGDGLQDSLERNKSFSKSSKEKFHGLGSFGKGRLKMKHRPSVLNEVRANADDVDISGYLKLWRKKTKRWRSMWFVLKGKAFYTYKASEDTAAKKSTVVLGYEVQPLATYFQGVESNLLFQLVHRGMTPMVFQTDSQASRERWMSALLKATVP